MPCGDVSTSIPVALCPSKMTDFLFALFYLHFFFMPEEQNHQTGEWKTFLLILLSPNAWIGFLVATFITMLVIGVVTYDCCIIKKKLLSVIPFHKKPTSCFSHMNIPRVFLLCGVGLAQIVDGQDYSHICETPSNYVANAELNLGQMQN